MVYGEISTQRLFTILRHLNANLLANHPTANQFESSQYRRYYAKACNNWRGPFWELSVWVTVTQLQSRSGGEPLATALYST